MAEHVIQIRQVVNDEATEQLKNLKKILKDVGSISQAYKQKIESVNKANEKLSVAAEKLQAANSKLIIRYEKLDKKILKIIHTNSELKKRNAELSKLKLEELTILRDMKIITEEEFQAEKKQLLGN